MRAGKQQQLRKDARQDTEPIWFFMRLLMSPNNTMNHPQIDPSKQSIFFLVRPVYEHCSTRNRFCSPLFVRFTPMGVWPASNTLTAAQRCRFLPGFLVLLLLQVLGVWCGGAPHGEQGRGCVYLYIPHVLSSACVVLHKNTIDAIASTSPPPAPALSTLESIIGSHPSYLRCYPSGRASLARKHFLLRTKRQSGGFFTILGKDLKSNH